MAHKQEIHANIEGEINSTSFLFESQNPSCFLFPVIFVGMHVVEHFRRSKMQIQVGIALKTQRVFPRAKSLKSGQIFSLWCRGGPGIPTPSPAALFKNERKKLCTKEFVRQAKILRVTQLQKHPSKVKELLLALISSIFQFTCYFSLFFS